MGLPNNIITRTHTAAADTMFKLVSAPMWFNSLNVHCLTNTAFYGDRTAQDAPLFVNDVFYCEHPIDLNQMYFKNYTGGSNCKIVAVGMLMTDQELLERGLI